MHRIQSPPDERLEGLRHDRDHLRIQISLLEDAEAADQERLHERRELAELDERLAKQQQPGPAKS